MSLLDEEDAESVLRHNSQRYTPFYATLAEAERAYRETRARGFAIRPRGMITGLTTVALALQIPSSREQLSIALSQTPEEATPAWIDRAVKFMGTEAQTLLRLDL